MHAVSHRGISIRLACEAFGISQVCYRYVGRRSAENDEIANWLQRLMDNHRNRGFGQRFATDRMWTYNHDRPNMAQGGFTPKQRLAMAAKFLLLNPAESGGITIVRGTVAGKALLI